MTIRTGRARCGALLVAVASAIAVPASDAQVISPPPRSTSGLFGGRQPADPNRTRQELTLTLDFLGAYDDNLSPGNENAIPDFAAPRLTGTSGTLAAVADYRRGRPTRNLRVSGRTVAAGYSNTQVPSLVGGRVSVRGFAQVFSRTTLDGWVEGDYTPTFTMGAFTPAVTATSPLPDPTTGVAELESLSARGLGSLTHSWNSAHSTGANHTYQKMRSRGLGEMETEQETISTRHSWSFLRNVSLAASAGMSRQNGGNLTIGRSQLETQDGSLGLDVRMPISRTRRMTFSGYAGATRVRTYSTADSRLIGYATPSGGGSVRVDIGRTWAISADASRHVGMLEGLTLQSFVTTATTLWAGGNIGTRTLVSLTGRHSRGAPHVGETGSFSSAGMWAQAEYTVSRCCALFANYSYYGHRLLDVAAVPVGFPTVYERNTARMGVTVWLPLYGTFPGGRSR